MKRSSVKNGGEKTGGVKTRGETVLVGVRFPCHHYKYLEIMELLKQDSEGWYAQPAAYYAARFSLKIDDFDSVKDFVEGIKIQQFAYMSFIDAIRWQLLENEKMYLRNVRGDGYITLNPNDQTKYGYEKFLKDVRKAIS